MKVKQQQVCVGWERENEHVHCQNFCRNCRGKKKKKKSSFKWRFPLSFPRGKFLLLFLVFATFPSFIPFSDLVLLFPLSPRTAVLPPAAGAPGGGAGARRARGAAGERGAGREGAPGGGHGCAGLWHCCLPARPASCPATACLWNPRLWRRELSTPALLRAAAGEEEARWQMCSQVRMGAVSRPSRPRSARTGWEGARSLPAPITVWQTPGSLRSPPPARHGHCHR